MVCFSMCASQIRGCLSAAINITSSSGKQIHADKTVLESLSEPSERLFTTLRRAVSCVAGIFGGYTIL